MHINDDHMYHGAALTQIADRPEFKAINAFKGIAARGAFQINNDIGVYIKHASAPSKNGEYVFTFNTKSFSDIEAMRKQCAKNFIVLVCVEDREICAFSLAEFDQHVKNRKIAFGGPENQYQILVTAVASKKFRVYVNMPGVKRKLLGLKLVSRNAFPALLF